MTQDAVNGCEPNSELHAMHARPPLTIFAQGIPDEAGEKDDDDNQDLTEDQKKMKRILANRGSARVSYQRRKKMIAGLKAKASEASRHKNALEVENTVLREQVKDLRQQVLILLSRQTAHEQRSYVGPEIFLTDFTGRSLVNSRPMVPTHSLEHMIQASQHVPIPTDVISLLTRQHLMSSMIGLPRHDC